MQPQNKKIAYCLFVAFSCVNFVGANAFVPSPRASSKEPRPGVDRSQVILPDRKSVNEQDSQTSDPLKPGIPRGGASLSDPPGNPTMGQFRRFALPCLGLWVAQPLLSLVDTAFVGLSGDSSSSARQLAALGPATTFFDGATYLFAFLNVATTNLYSSARAQSGQNSDKAESVVRTAARVSSRCGVGIMLFLLTFARPLLALYIGKEATSTPGLLDAAVSYVKIRAFSMPTSLVLGVVQSACLGAKDSVTPLIAILYSTVVNVVGDYILVKKNGMGLEGAAIATLIAQWVATLALLGPARKRLLRNPKLGIFKKPQSTAETVSGRSFLGFAAPVLTLILGKLAAFGFLTNSAAGVPGQPIPLASHQIILSLFFFASPFLEVISQTAQTFLPPFLAPVSEYVAEKRRKDPTYAIEADPRLLPWRKAAFDVGNTLLRLGFISGAIVASISSAVPAFRGSLLTSDLEVQAAVKPLSKYLWMGAFLTAPVAVSEGILLAKRELKFLASIYVVSTILLPPALVQVKVGGGNVEQVWACFAIFQLFRAIAFAGRIWFKSILTLITQTLSGKKTSLKDTRLVQ